MPCPPLLLEVLLCLACAAVLSRRLSRALKLLETATLALVSLAESTLELPKRRPHLLARVLRADGGPDDGDGEGDGEGAAAVVVNTRESSVNVNLAGNFFKVLPTFIDTHIYRENRMQGWLEGCQSLVGRFVVNTVMGRDCRRGNVDIQLPFKFRW